MNEGYDRNINMTSDLPAPSKTSPVSSINEISMDHQDLKVSDKQRTKDSMISKTKSTKGKDSKSKTKSDVKSLPAPKVEKEHDDSKDIPSPAPNTSVSATEVEDEEVRLAMEMALAAAQNPKLTPAEIRELVGERNKQAKIVDEFSQKKKEEIEREKQEEVDEAQKRWDEKKEVAINWWQAKSLAVKESVEQLTEAAMKKAEEMKHNAEMRLYADQIKKDPEHIELRKKIKVLRKVYKAHRLQGNRVETRHQFKRQRMEKKLLQVCDKLNKTQRLLTHSSYNVQEYLKAMMKSSKKWRKKGTDEELMLEAQLCRNMHQMLALEKQKVKGKKSQREMKKYLQRCKGWLTDKKAFCEMNQMTLEATSSSMKVLYEDIIFRQDELIKRLKADDEFKDIDLSEVDVSNARMPILPSARTSERFSQLNAMKGLPIKDSIRIKKDASLKDTQNHTSTSRPELYVIAKDDGSVSSALSDPDEPLNVIDEKNNNKFISDEDSSSQYNFGSDAPWKVTSNSSVSSKKSASSRNPSPERRAVALPPDPIEEEDELDNIASKSNLPKYEEEKKTESTGN